MLAGGGRSSQLCAAARMLPAMLLLLVCLLHVPSSLFSKGWCLGRAGPVSLMNMVFGERGGLQEKSRKPGSGWEMGQNQG